MPGSRILVVEDEFIIAEVMKDQLESIGFEQCVHAATLDEALQALNEDTWNGAFLDIRLNGALVFPVAERLQISRVPFAFCSGDSDSGAIPTSFSAGPVLPKPWGAGELEQLAKRIFGTSN
jgi:CheY-like chemotaxis protein